MCLVVIAHDLHPAFRLVVAGNRDEEHSRPAEHAKFWPDLPDIFGGRDLRSGGTWLGVTTAQRFATITNYRDPQDHHPRPTSRGVLVTGFLDSSASADEYARSLAGSGSDYAGYSIIVYDGANLTFYSNREGAVRPLGAGIFGVSNHLLDTSWPKLERARAGMRAALLEQDRDAIVESLLTTLRDESPAEDAALPDTGVGLEVERLLSPIFIRSETYGTRASTVVLIGRDDSIYFVERSWAPSGALLDERRAQVR